MLVRKIMMDCPLCDKVHEIEERRRNTSVSIKDTEVNYEETYYYCCNSKEDECEFENGKMLNSNLLNARNSYRRLKGYLTSYEIVKIREKYGVSQVELAKLLGWGEATISRYESKAIQDEAYDNMLRLVKNDPLKALEFLEKNSEKFSVERKEEIKRNIMKEIDAHGKEFSARQSLKCDYVIYDNLSEQNGFTLLNIDKVESVISYYAERLINLRKEKMVPMLWYADAIAYKQNKRAITGLVYKGSDVGVMPVGFRRIMSLERVNSKEEETIHGTRYLFKKHNDVDQKCLSENELEILDKVVEKFRDYNTKDIVAYLKDENAYKNIVNGNIISFEIAKEIKSFH